MVAKVTHANGGDTCVFFEFFHWHDALYLHTHACMYTFTHLTFIHSKGTGTVDDGRNSRRGNLPGMGFLRFDELYDTALAGSILMEGRALAAFVRDRSRSSFSGLAVQSAQLASRYNLRDERQIRSPPLLSLKFLLFLIRPLRYLIKIDDREGVASGLQRFIFGTLPDIPIPQFILKLIQGTPLTMKWLL